MITALSFTSIYQDKYAIIILLIIGILLIFHGFYELCFKPKIFLKYLLKKWLLNRHSNLWQVYNYRRVQSGVACSGIAWKRLA